MKVQNRKIGEVELAREAILSFPEGILGFEDQREFALYLPEELRPFGWLLSTHDPDLAFAICDPEPFLTEPYGLSLTELDQATLELLEGDSVRVYVIVGPPDAGARLTANLKGPVIVNRRARRAKQLLLYSARLAVRQPLQERGGWGSAARTSVRTVTRRAA